MTPQRIQRRRQKGWRNPPGAIYVGRPSKWGNPFRPDPVIDRVIEYVHDGGVHDGLREPIPVAYFRVAVEGAISGELIRKPEYERWFWMAENLHELCGRDLVCWCPLDVPCHADVLLELAN